MMSNHHFAKSIADASLYQIQIFTKHKAEENAHECVTGKLVDFVDPKDTISYGESPQTTKVTE